MDVVDKIASLKTDSRDAPVDTEKAKMTKVTVTDWILDWTNDHPMTALIARREPPNPLISSAIVEMADYLKK